MAEIAEHIENEPRELHCPAVSQTEALAAPLVAGIPQAANSCPDFWARLEPQSHGTTFSRVFAVPDALKAIQPPTY